MKHLSLVVCLSLVAFVANLSIASADDYDSSKATFTKSSDSMAKVTMGSHTYMAPIMFTDGATWDSVKDHYEVPDAASAGMANGTESVSIGSDGTASFAKCAKSCSKESSKTPAKK